MYAYVHVCINKFIQMHALFLFIYLYPIVYSIRLNCILFYSILNNKQKRAQCSVRYVCVFVFIRLFPSKTILHHRKVKVFDFFIFIFGEKKLFNFFNTIDKITAYLRRER